MTRNFEERGARFAGATREFLRNMGPDREEAMLEACARSIAERCIPQETAGTYAPRIYEILRSYGAFPAPAVAQRELAEAIRGLLSHEHGRCDPDPGTACPHILTAESALARNGEPTK